MSATLEHTNLTVSDPDATAKWLCEVFGWDIRWQGAAIGNGRTVHVGNESSYLALYSPGKPNKSAESSYANINGLNHLGIVVGDLDATEARVKAHGFTPHNHGDYEPGRRFYFDDNDGVEFEVVSYA